MIRTLLSKTLRKAADDLDNGSCNLSESEMLEIVDHMKELNDKNAHLSKHEACRFLNVSRATFDRYIASGKIARGEKRVGFTELSWSKSYLVSVREQLITHSAHA